MGTINRVIAEREFGFCGIISGTARCVNTKRPLTHLLDSDERGLAVKATQDKLALLAVGKKQCTGCGSIKLLDDFYASKRGFGGRRAYCKVCWSPAGRKQVAASSPELLARRLMERSERSSEGCLRWTGAHTSKGYGQITVDGRHRCAHIIAHEVWIGPVPAGFEVDHVHAKGCRHRDCIEPSHLEAITHGENIRRVAELITNCPQGHDYTPENIQWRPPRKPGHSRRRCCRRCLNEARRAKRAADRMAARGESCAR